MWVARCWVFCIQFYADVNEWTWTYRVMTWGLSFLIKDLNILDYDQFLTVEFCDLGQGTSDFYLIVCIFEGWSPASFLNCSSNYNLKNKLRHETNKSQRYRIPPKINSDHYFGSFLIILLVKICSSLRNK